MYFIPVNLRIIKVIAPMHVLIMSMICGLIIPGYCRNSFGILRRLFYLTLWISSWCEMLYLGRDWLTGCGGGGCCCIDRFPLDLASNIKYSAGSIIYEVMCGVVRDYMDACGNV